jgi:hypothetical protein
VFSAVAASLAADVSLAEGTAPSTAAKIAASFSKNAATIERTQTVNVFARSDVPQLRTLPVRCDQPR